MSFTKLTTSQTGHIIIIKLYLQKILTERAILMAKTNLTPIPVTENNEQEKFMLYPTKLFNETDDDEFKCGTSAVASHTYLRGLVMGTCDKFGHPVVILQRNHNLQNCDNCEKCGKDENTAFCGKGRFLRLESTLFYDHWAKVCKKIRDENGKIKCCQRDEIVAEFLLDNLNRETKEIETISFGDEKIELHIMTDKATTPHMCIRYECPVSHYDEIAVNINVNGIEGVMIIGQLLFGDSPSEQVNEFEKKAKSVGYHEEEIKLLVESAKVKKKNFTNKNASSSKGNKKQDNEFLNADDLIKEIFDCIEKLEDALKREYEFKTDVNVKELQEKMIKAFNDCYEKREKFEKEHINNVKRCEKKYELLKTAFYSSLKVFNDAADVVTELFASVPKGLYFNSLNVLRKINTETDIEHTELFVLQDETDNEKFLDIGKGYYMLPKKLDVTEKKFVRIIIKTQIKDDVIDRLFNGFLQFVCLYITELFAQYNGAQIYEYTTMMRHELGQLNEAILIRINTFQEAIGKQNKDKYTYSFITECNHIIDDYKSHAHSTMLRCNSSRYFSQLPDMYKELFYPYESFLYKWKYIYEKAAKNKHVKFLMDTVQLADLTRPRMYADKSMIEQVAYNLTNNAIKYSISGTTLSIDCKLNEQKNAYQLIVSNYGRSISEEEINSIFDYGFRGSNNNEANGSGLGLYLSKEIAKKHNGELTLEVEKVSDYDVSCLYLYSEMPEKFQSSEIAEDINKELFRLKESKYSTEIEKPYFSNQSFTPYLITRYLNTGTVKYKFVLSIPYDKNIR